MSNSVNRQMKLAKLAAVFLLAFSASVRGQTPKPTPTPDASPTPTQEIREPNFPAVQPEPVPPLPDLTRVGVTASNTLALSMNDAIRRALQNNNDIEVAKDDVRVSEQRLRALYGVYQPIFSVT